MEENNTKKTAGITTGNDPIDLNGFSDDAIVRIHLRGEAQQTNGKIVEMTVGKLRKLLDEKFILSRNNTLFLKHEIKLGVVAQWCKYFYEYRKSIKKEMAKVSKQIYEKAYADENEKLMLEDRLKSLHDLQLSVKLQLNSVYGILGTPYSPMYNTDIAQSITRNGKFCNISSSKFIKERFKELYGTDDSYPSTIYGDTDSCTGDTMLRVNYDKDPDGVLKKCLDFCMKTNFDNIAIRELYNKYVARGIIPVEIHSGHELVMPDDNLQVLTIGGIYKKVKVLSRHKTIKPLVEIGCSNGKSITVTTDHICMAYNDDHILENTAAKDLKPGSFIKYYDKTNGELNGSVVSIINIGPTEDYVYDLEVEDDSHVYYANDILVHNSLFINVGCISDRMRVENPSLPKQLMKWDDDSKFELWKRVSGFVDNEVVPFVQKLVKETCHTNHPEMLRYGLEYVADTAFYEKPKHYAVHKMIDEGPELVDKIKFMGIELKKATLPVKVKEFLAEIYEKTMTDDTWNEAKFKDFITICYNKFKTLSIDDIASWKGYKSARESDGFLSMSLGATGISKGCTYYNQMVDKLGVGKKYDKINLGDKVRFIYINPNNQYRINCMAFPASTGWPAEFNKIFTADYDKMFEGIMSSIKSYMAAIGFRQIDPRKTDMQNLDDL